MTPDLGSSTVHLNIRNVFPLHADRLSLPGTTATETSACPSSLELPEQQVSSTQDSPDCHADFAGSNYSSMPAHELGQTEHKHLANKTWHISSRTTGGNHSAQAVQAKLQKSMATLWSSASHVSRFYLRFSRHIERTTASAAGHAQGGQHLSSEKESQRPRAFHQAMQTYAPARRSPAVIGCQYHALHQAERVKPEVVPKVHALPKHQ